MQQPEFAEEKALRYKKQFDIPEYDIIYHHSQQDTGRSFRKDRGCVPQSKESQQLAHGRDYAPFERKRDGTGGYCIFHRSIWHS